VEGTDWLYAIGDVNGRALLTHMGKYHGRIAADAIAGRGATVDPLADGLYVPRVVFTEPQVAAVGHTLESARAAGSTPGPPTIRPAQSRVEVSTDDSRQARRAS
jgi:dihydrolipoamide dehydrogenase